MKCVCITILSVALGAASTWALSDVMDPPKPPCKCGDCVCPGYPCSCTPKQCEDAGCKCGLAKPQLDEFK